MSRLNLLTHKDVWPPIAQNLKQNFVFQLLEQNISYQGLEHCMTILFYTLAEDTKQGIKYVLEKLKGNQTFISSVARQDGRDFTAYQTSVGGDMME